MILRPFFSFYGSKWRMAPSMPAPRHPKIVEPFAGSAGYSLRYPGRRIVLADADPVISGLWAYLIKVSEAEILSIPDLPIGGTVADMGLTVEQSWLVGFWVNKGAAAPRGRPSKWMRSGIRPGSFWGLKVRNRIASQLRFIRHWEVHPGSYETLVNKEATWFVDPPYQVAGKHYRHGSAGIDYNALGEWCRGRLGQVTVCEAQGAEWLPFRPLGSFKSSRKARSMESIWENDRTVKASVLGSAK